jgi:ABC-2 type transport system ATP-binding protein
MRISLSDAGKRFNRDWIFRHLNLDFQQNNSYAITGPNGSGKSTLLQMLAGAILPSEGTVIYHTIKKAIDPSRNEEVHDYFALAAPYLELIEEMTLSEFLTFHSGFKSLQPGYDARRIIEIMRLSGNEHKQIRNFSSGMKQRVKLGIAIFSASPCLFLDEPCTNLDSSGIELYQSLISEQLDKRMIVISSNDKVEYEMCGEVVRWR